jgi:hypothetical protein
MISEMRLEFDLWGRGKELLHFSIRYNSILRGGIDLCNLRFI